MGDVSVTLCSFDITNDVLIGFSRTNAGFLELSLDFRRTASLMGSSESAFGGHCSSSGVSECYRQGCLNCGELYGNMLFWFRD